ncbi:MAG TPA: hypothetical protein VL306_02520 [Methylomirabilota bacterium]|nr:hypothetical protein [Methylomirabilota bacterium]
MVKRVRYTAIENYLAITVPALLGHPDNPEALEGAKEGKAAEQALKIGDVEPVREFLQKEKDVWEAILQNLGPRSADDPDLLHTKRYLEDMERLLDTLPPGQDEAESEPQAS